VSVHPPHLLDTQGNYTPAAFIPFCSYSGDMDSLGQSVDGLDIPVCNKFQPSMMDGQLCYTLNISSVISPEEIKTKFGETTGIILAVDQYKDTSADKEENGIQGLFDPKRTTDQKSLSIHINTQSRYTSSSPGKYILTVLKKMTGTDSFLALSDEAKGCQIEPEDECRSRKLEERCGCVPWALSCALTDQVSTYKVAILITLSSLRAPAALMAPPATPPWPRTPSAAESPAPASMLMLMF
jgi:hypothetical protein